MVTPLRRSPRRRSAVSGDRAHRPVVSRFVTTLALAAIATLTAVPAAHAQSTLEANGTITVSSLGSTADTTGSAAGSLGSLVPDIYPEYVALGDSYAALGDNRESAGGPPGCARSLANYPNQLNAADSRIGDLTDVTCGGAQIPDLTDPQFPGAPAQFDALRTDTDLVTLSIGGNDVGFGLIVGCITKQGPFTGVPNCEAVIGDAVDADIAETFGVGGQIDQVYDAIETASPGATIIATQYMPLMPETGSCAFTDQLNPDDVQWSREVAEAINDAVNAAATRNGHVSVLPTDDVDRSACAPVDQRWTDFTGIETNTAPMHPTALGQKAMAGAIGAAL